MERELTSLIAMPTCPRCQQNVKVEQVSCSYCGYQLKAFGHPGIPLYHAEGEETYLCPSCIYHQDDTCNFPQRPRAKSCTLYQDIAQPPEPEIPRPNYGQGGLPALKSWLWRRRGLVLLLLLVLISVAIAIR